MNIREYLESQEQSEKSETMRQIVEFRDEFLEAAEQTDSVQARLLANTLAHALLGMHFGYRPCCVLEFCQRTYYKLHKGDIAICPDTGAVMCKKCKKDFVQTNRVRGVL